MKPRKCILAKWSYVGDKLNANITYNSFGCVHTVNPNLTSQISKIAENRRGFISKTKLKNYYTFEKINDFLPGSSLLYIMNEFFS